VCLAADVIARSLPIDGLCFQAWECMTRYQEPGSIFEANRQFRSARTHGNMSNMGNLPDERVYRPQVFTTDGRGFRNTAVDEANVRIVMVGDSFVAGYGISDDETLPTQLTARSGSVVYNAGGPYAYLATVRELKRQMKLAQPTAVIVWSESEPIELLQAAEDQAGHPNFQARVVSTAFGSAGGRVREVLRGWWFTSPLKVITQKAFLAASNDRFLPNVYAHLVTQRQLKNGASMLFLPSDVEPFHAHRDVRPAADYLQWLTSAMAKEGVKPVVVLVPHKYSVYYPLLSGAQPAPGDDMHPLAQLEQVLRAQGIEALDLTPMMRERAAEDLARGEYVYWRDDTHWDGRGVSVAADAITHRWFSGGAAGQ
jgi:hypothetical protein